MTLFQDVKRLWLEKPDKFLAWFLVAVTALRIAGLLTSNLNLGPDEAQYWWWSKDFAFGYFSKPPMVSWLIGATTAIFGDGEWAVRLSSPIIGAITGWFIWLTAKRLYDDRTALWAAIVWVTVPAIMLGALIITTDIPLLMFWSIALYAFVRLTEKPSLPYAAILGLAIGLGMMSKYAMIYFPLGMALAFLFSRRARSALRPVEILITLAVAGAVFLPNIIWNANNGFQTLEHTQANAGWGGNLFHPDELAEFFLAQFAVAGPVLFGFLLYGLATLRRRIDQPHAGADRLLLAFGLPPLLIILFQATISGANANWAMTAYPALIMLVTAWMLRGGHRKLLGISTGAHAAIGIIGLIAISNFALLDAMGLANSIKRVRGWPQQVAEIETFAKDYPVVVVDDRELMGNILYYMRDSGKPVKAIDYNRRIEHGYEAFDAFDPTQYDRALLVAKYPRYLYSYVEFGTREEVGLSSMDMGVPCPRRYWLFELSDFDPSKGPQDIPPPPTEVSRPVDDCKPY